MTYEVKFSASRRNNTIVNWNNGSGVACFFPFLANNGVSSESSTWPLMVRKETRNKSEDHNRHSFMRLPTKISVVQGSHWLPVSSSYLREVKSQVIDSRAELSRAEPVTTLLSIPSTWMMTVKHLTVTLTLLPYRVESTMFALSLLARHLYPVKKCSEN